MIVNENNEVVAMIEIKANMGWCRDAANVIDYISTSHNKFKKVKKLNCEFSREDDQVVTYSKDVKLFLISCTDGNCSALKHTTNKSNAQSKNIYYFNLFQGWYDALTNCEIEDFIAALM